MHKKITKGPTARLGLQWDLRILKRQKMWNASRICVSSLLFLTALPHQFETFETNETNETRNETNETRNETNETRMKQMKQNETAHVQFETCATAPRADPRAYLN